MPLKKPGALLMIMNVLFFIFFFTRMQAIPTGFYLFYALQMLSFTCVSCASLISTRVWLILFAKTCVGPSRPIFCLHGSPRILSLKQARHACRMSLGVPDDYKRAIFSFFSHENNHVALLRTIPSDFCLFYVRGMLSLTCAIRG
ncbi:hypothetical protein BC940DRAFT_24679 [Gongronella butleri]|nr:hypothetical protein BC940DRAFT_24679 [Gongronella butleri]